MNTALLRTLGLFAGWTAITVLGGHLTTAGNTSLPELVSRGPGWQFVAAGALLLAAVARAGTRREVGLCAPVSARSLLLAWLPALYIAAGLGLAAHAGLPAPATTGWILFNTLLVGFSEELMFRGVLLRALRHALPVWPAVWLTSLAFGAIHSLNVFITGDLRAALLQSTAAFLSGLIFIALRLRTGSLWPGIVVHGLWDFATFLLVANAAAGAADGPHEIRGAALLAPVLLVLPNALCGLWLMRRIATTHADPVH